MTFDTVILTCEHAGAVVPPPYRRLFGSQKARRALATHRGLDLGSLAVARALARRFHWPLHTCRVTRLLVDVNRSRGHRRLFSEFSAGLDPRGQADVLERFYAPHRQAVESSIRRAIQRRQRVLHLSVHTFTPRLGNEVRHADLGLLYDPVRRGERILCAEWVGALRQRAPSLRARRNYPYRGIADGFTTELRRRFAAGVYAGVEIEVNQRLVANPGAARTATIRVLVDSLQTVLARRSRPRRSR